MNNPAVVTVIHFCDSRRVLHKERKAASPSALQHAAGGYGYIRLSAQTPRAREQTTRLNVAASTRHCCLNQAPGRTYKFDAYTHECTYIYIQTLSCLQQDRARGEQQARLKGWLYYNALAYAHTGRAAGCEVVYG